MMGKIISFFQSFTIFLFFWLWQKQNFTKLGNGEWVFEEGKRGQGGAGSNLIAGGAGVKYFFKIALFPFPFPPPQIA